MAASSVLRTRSTSGSSGIRLIPPGGKPIGDAKVSVVDPQPNANAGKETTTDGEGKHRLASLAPQGFSVAGTAVGYRRAECAICYWVTPLNPSHDTSGFQFVNVPSGLSFHAHTCRV